MGSVFSGEMETDSGTQGTAESNGEMAVTAHLHIKQRDARLFSHLPSKGNSQIYTPLTKGYSPLMESPREQTNT